MASRSPRWPVAAFILLVLSCGDGAVEPPATPPPVPTTVTVSPATAALSALGETARFTAEVRDQNGQGMAAASVAWASSDASVASVDDSGLVTAAANGTATITARASSASGTAVVTVAQVVSAVAVSPSADTLVALGDTVRLTAEAADANGHAVVAVTAFEWSSSDTLVATVDSAGVVTAVGGGNTTVTATMGSVSGAAVVTVMQSAGSVVVSPSADTIGVGDTLRLEAEAFDGNGHTVVGAMFSWSSSDAGVARVDDAGLVEAVAAGTARIRAAVGDASGVAEISVASPDRAALVALYEATDGPNWVRSENWLTDARLGTWHGVRGTVDGRVAGLRLHDNGLTGSIPAELGDLTLLTDLSLLRNELAGPIPPELGNLVNLTNLELSENRLTGPIPPALGNLVQLNRMRLTENQLTGSIPREFGNLAELTSLVLSYNRLTGSIPSGLGNLTNLTRLYLSYNQLTGTIPVDLGNLASLEVLNLSDNRLTGPIPERLLDLTRLRYFSVDRNDGICAPGTRVYVDWTAELDFRGKHCNDADFTVLQLLHETAGGGNWSRSDGWGESATLGEWFGVTADSLGYVVALDLSGNGLSGRLPATLGALTRMTRLHVDDNELSGRLPLSLIEVPLRDFAYRNTGLCAPADRAFQTWLNTIASHEGTDVQCPVLSERDMLVEVFDALGGPKWVNNNNWLTDAPLGDWHGVDVDDRGRVVALRLYRNRLRGAIPPVLGRLSGLVSLQLEGNNGLTGPIPPELGDLQNLEYLNLKWNRLRHPIPPEIGNLRKLNRLDLELARLRGSIPPEIGRLASLRYLNLSRNGVDGGALAGPIPGEMGDLTELNHLDLGENDLSGTIPVRIGRLVNLDHLDLSQNRLTGPVPREVGDLGSLRTLNLGDNELTGEIPAEIGDLATLRSLNLSGNPLGGTIPKAIGGLSELRELWLEGTSLGGSIPAELGVLANLRELRMTGSAELEGALPTELTSLQGLEVLLAGQTRLCAPGEPRFQAWLQRVPKRRIAPCSGGEPAAVYLTQAVQSREFPVPLVAGERALLRVFATSRIQTTAVIPDVRATFYSGGNETHTVTIPSKPEPIPTTVLEGALRHSANIEIPGWVVAPGLEMVIEIDPDGTLDAGLGVARRIPESGRLRVDVQAVPLLDLTLVPFVVAANPDTSIVGLTREMAADPENHEVLWGIRDMMPVGDLKVTAHAPVRTTTDDIGTLLEQTSMIRVAEGATGHYMGMLSYFFGGRAYQGGKSSLSEPSPATMAHEIGHNFNLLHAPCPRIIIGPDPSFPHPHGVIGVWGYDFRDGGHLVDPRTPDVMGYCGGYEWLSDYHFTNALRYRLLDESAGGSATTTAADRSLLVWGGIAADTALFLEPAFVIDAPPVLPDSVGEYELSGRAADGLELFALRFGMSPVADADGRASFVFALPVRPGWQDNLATITLSGPTGSVTLDSNSDRGMVILRDPRTRQIRGILRDLPPVSQAAMDVAGWGVGPELEVMFSRGIPAADAWRR